MQPGIARKGGAASCYSFLVPRFFPMRRRFRSPYGANFPHFRILALCIGCLTLSSSPSRAQTHSESRLLSATDGDSAAVALEVAGRLVVKAESQVTAPRGLIRVLGRVTDENNLPAIAELDVDHAGRVLPWHPCADAGLNRTPHDSALVTDQQGNFCALVEPAEQGGSFVVHARAPHHDSATSPAPLRDVREAAPPTFISAPERLSKDAQLYVVELLASSGDSPRATLSLELDCESSSAPLGEEPVRGSTMLRFEFTRPSARPGHCRFVATTSTALRKLKSEREVLVVGQVQLNLSKEERRADHVDLVLTLRTLNLPVREGIVEARVGDDFESSAPVQAGKARLRIARKRVDREAEVHFVPANPAHEPGHPLSVPIPRRQAAWSWAPWHSLLLVGFAGWMTSAWFRPKRRLQEAEPLRPQSPTIQTTDATVGHIRGQVLDADSLQPIVGARVQLERRGAEQSERWAITESDLQGRFRFEQEFAQSTLLFLRFEHADYMTLGANVVAAEAKAFLQSRRRAAVGQLISWAQRRGEPWHILPAPTTGHVERLAEERREGATSSWAAEVGRAAYGPEPPTEKWVSSLRDPLPEAPRRQEERLPKDLQ